jgi:mevalonate kinase
MGLATASAPGKLMLFGEHAVLYGQPCIVTAVDLRVQVTVEIMDAPIIQIKTPLRGETFSIELDEILEKNEFPKDISFISIAIKKYMNLTDQKFGASIKTKSQFTHSYGLGSSSAVTVAALKALSQATSISITPEQIFDLGYQTVLEAQNGAASGFDVAAATFGGILYYVAGGQTIEKINVNSLPLIVCYSGTKASTVEQIKKVSDLYREKTNAVNQVMLEIGKIVDEAKECLSEGNILETGRLMKKNQDLLERLGVSTENLDKLIDLAHDAGSYGAKLSGAGGGDCIIAVADEDKIPDVKAALSKSKIDNAKVLSLSPLAEGVRIDEVR